MAPCGIQESCTHIDEGGSTVFFFLRDYLNSFTSHSTVSESFLLHLHCYSTIFDFMMIKLLTLTGRTELIKKLITGT